MFDSPTTSLPTLSPLTESHALLLLLTGLAIGNVFGLAGCASTESGSARSIAAAKDRDQWHAKRLETLAAEDGWLTLVGLDFLEEGEHVFGSAERCALRYRSATSPVVGAFVVVGDQVAFRAETVGVTVDGAAVHGSVTLRADDQGSPSVLRNGSLAITVVRRNGALALRVKDNASLVRTQFRGIELFPYDPTLVVEAEAVPPAPGETIAITNVTGFVETQPVAARLRFKFDSTPMEFLATAGAHGRLFVVFADATNGRESYGGGRFLDVAAPIDGKTAIDFNRATNPPCAFTAFATCPMPPEANRVSGAIPAGERAPK